MFIEYMLGGGLVLMVVIVYLAGRHDKPGGLLSEPEEICHCPPSPPSSASAPSSPNGHHGHPH